MLIERFDVENNCVLAEVDCYGNKGIRLSSQEEKEIFPVMKSLSQMMFLRE